MRKFIIDTDAGVDDAIALMMALDAHKRGEIREEGIQL
jgi:inosine-uridine nucleoside N-ribohydrolase